MKPSPSLVEDEPAASPPSASRSGFRAAPFGLRHVSRTAVADWPIGIIAATAMLFAVSPVLAEGSITSGALQSMLPFAALLAISAIGQLLVVEQRGFDLSVPGQISLAAVLVTKYADGNDSQLAVAAGLAFGACLLCGALNGLVITRLGVTPVVATLGSYSIIIGAILQITGGSATASSAGVLREFASGSIAGVVPNTVVVAFVVTLVIAVMLHGTVAGRRYRLAGTNPIAAYAAGVSTRSHEFLAYLYASLCYALTGVLLAGFLDSPGINAGEPYLLPTFAAVILGGSSLIGGEGRVFATAIGALFLTQLDMVVRGTGAPSSIQLIVQGAIIALGMAVRLVPWGYLVRAIRPSKGETQ